MTQNILARATASLGKTLETPLAIATCASDPQQCVINSAISLLSADTFYKIPQYMASAGKTFAHISGSIVTGTCPTLGNFIGNWIVEPVTTQTSKAFQAVNSLVVNNLISFDKKTLIEETIEKDLMADSVCAANPFSALHLIGASLLSGYFAKQSLKNMAHVALNVKRLVTGQRTVTEFYKESGSPTSFEWVENFTTLGLLKDITLDSLVTLLWTGSAIQTNLGMIEALKLAGATQPVLTAMIATSIATAVYVGPTIKNWIQCHRENKTQDVLQIKNHVDQSNEISEIESNDEVDSEVESEVDEFEEDDEVISAKKLTTDDLPKIIYEWDAEEKQYKIITAPAA